VSWYDWLLFLHVASAFAIVAALVVYWLIAVAGRNVDRPRESLRYFRMARPANVLVIAGTVGALIFGIWLALYVDGYELWDGWIIAAFVLWAIAVFTGQRGGVTYAEAQRLATRLEGEGRGDEPSTELRTLLQDRRAMWLNIASSLAVLLLLVDMIYKPGA
jgi:amino acid transporter